MWGVCQWGRNTQKNKQYLEVKILSSDCKICQAPNCTEKIRNLRDFQKSHYFKTAFLNSKIIKLKLKTTTDLGK